MIARPLRPFGVEIDGFAIEEATELSASDVVDIVSRHRVAVFRRQTASDGDLVRFLSLLGELTFTDGETPVVGAPDLNVVTNVGRTAPPRSVFHTDTSYVARPPAFTAMRAVEVPRAGGATLFSDQVKAAATLPAEIRANLEGRTVRHGLAGLAGDAHAVRHPLFRRHPLTGEIALFLSTPERCTELSGFDPESSAREIARLYAHSTQPDGLYRHAWQDGDVVLWDDRTTMHKADHDGVDGDRILHRGLVLGEVPIPA